jgi:Tol biopolymer transport system component
MKIGQLYLADVETGGLTTLTDLAPLAPKSGWWIISATVSPDGNTVLFHLPRGTSEDESWDLWTIPITGGTPTLLRHDASFPSYGPDGSIAFLDHPSDLSGDLWVMDADGSHARKLVGNGSVEWPKMSPDGTRVAYQQGETAYIVDVAAGRSTRVTSGTEPGWVDNDTLIVG